MNGYYPDRIAADDDEDDNLSSCSAEIEGGVAVGTGFNGASSLVGNCYVSPPPPGTPRNNSNFNGSEQGTGTPLIASRKKGSTSRPWHAATKSSGDEDGDSDDDYGDDYHEDLYCDDSGMEVSQHGKTNKSKDHSREDPDPRSNVTKDASNEADDNEWIAQEKNRQMAFLIQNERQRRLGVRSTITNANIDVTTNNFSTTTSSNTTSLEGQEVTLSGQSSQNNDGGILRGIRGWFAASTGGGNASDNNIENKGGAPSSSGQPQMQQNSLNRRSSAPVVASHSNNILMNNSSHGKRGSALGVPNLKAENSLNINSSESKHANSNVTTSSATSNDDDGDSSSSCNSDSSDSSQSSSDWSTENENADPSNNNNGMSNRYQHHTTPQERARIRALRYLSNSCVDAGRKAKTASYVRGLERLDLKRKRDRYEKELEVVETEMNKDRGVAAIGGGSTGVCRRNSLTFVGRIEENEELVGEDGGVDMQDIVCKMAYQLVRELPLLKEMMGKESDAGSGADAGAGKPTSKHFITFEEYAEATSAQEDAGVYTDDGTDPPNLWKNKKCVDIYMAFLQKRFKEALERTRSLEKRLAVLEQTGDEIVSSLCEDLVDITEHSNKTEARYVKKGKGLHRKRRREVIRHREKLKKADAIIRKLEERLVVVSGGGVDAVAKVLEDSDSSKSDSSMEEEDEENDEIRLERKLASIKAKDEEDKASHQSEVDSIRRQCEQLKLRLSVARLVMEGDDNLREYIAVLDRLNPSVQQQRNSKRSSSCWSSYVDNNYDENQLSEILGATVIPPPPPSRVTRARAKLLKATHLEHIYTQRMAVTKAFTDATINALEQELSEREEAGQKMEVRCLNELMAIDSEMKEIIQEFRDKMAGLETEAKQLKEAIAACCAEKGIDACLVDYDHLNPNIRGDVSLKGKVESKPDPKKTDIESDINMNSSKQKDETNGTEGPLEKSAEGPMITSQDNSKFTTISCDDENNTTNEAKELQIVFANQCKHNGEDSDRASNGIYDGHNEGPAPEVKNVNVVQSSPGESTYLGNIVTSTYNQEDQPHKNELVDGNQSFDHIENEEQRPAGKQQHDSGEGNSTRSEISSPPKGNNENANQSSRPDKDDSEVKTKPSRSESRGTSIGADNLSVLPSQQKAVLELLGRELTCTLADYQTGFDLSSSEERIQQLEYMNNVVLKIAKVRGLEIAPKAETAGVGKFESWSLKPRSNDDDIDDDSTNKHRSKKKKEKKKHKKRRKHHRRERNRKEEPVSSLKSILRQGVKNNDEGELEAKNVFITTHDQLVW